MTGPTIQKNPPSEGSGSDGPKQQALGQIVAEAVPTPTKVLLGSMAWVHRSYLTRGGEQKMREALTVVPHVNEKARNRVDEDGEPLEDPARPMFLFDDSKPDWFGMAREYYLHRWKPHHQIVLDVSVNRAALPSPLTFAGTLRPDQQRAISDVMRALCEDRSGTRYVDPAEVKIPIRLGGFIQAPTGAGKTVMACALLACLGVPAVVIVHREHLLDQWRLELEKFLPGVQIGLAQGKRVDWQGKHVVLGMLQSLAKQEYPQEFWDWPGLVLADEGHRLSARGWSRAIPRFKARWRIAVTATPHRKDRTENAFLYHVGEILHRAEVIQLLPTVKSISTQYVAPTSIAHIDAKVMKLMSANGPRNALILEQVVGLLKEGRTLFVLSKKRDHLSNLDALFEDAWLVEQARESAKAAVVRAGVELSRRGGDTPVKLRARDLLKRTFEVPERAMCVGGLSDAEMERVKHSARVVWATAQFVSEAFNVPRLDTLLLTLPMVDVEQAVGRILRRCEGKKAPLVVDFLDDAVPFARKYASARERVYGEILMKYSALGTPRAE